MPKPNFTPLIIPFYLDQKPDPAGRKISEIWAWDFDCLEAKHDYIQWLFPTVKPSFYHPEAPTLDPATIAAFHTDPVLRRHLFQSFRVLLHFFGLHVERGPDGQPQVSRAAHYPSRHHKWTFEANHNYQRITRILDCLMTLGLQPCAQAFYRCLTELYHDPTTRISDRTFQFWTEAVSRPSSRPSS